LLQYTGIQTFERALNRYNLIYQTWLDIFDSIRVEFMGKVYADLRDLKKKLDKLMPDIQPEIRNQLYMLMDYEGNSIISLSDYECIVSPWASFSATDINGDNELDICELKTLLWLNDKKEPSALRVAAEMKVID
jgi:hypothetical protein